MSESTALDILTGVIMAIAILIPGIVVSTAYRFTRRVTRKHPGHRVAKRSKGRHA